MIDTRHLETFRAIVENGGFSRAADVLGCVQSNVTARMRKLEEQLGTALFERDGRATRLTQAGEVLDGYASRIVALIEEAEAVLADGGRVGLRLGAMENTVAVRLPALIKRLRQRFPDAPLALVTGPTDELIASVAARKLDAAFVAGRIEHEALNSVPAFREVLVRVAPKGHMRVSPKNQDAGGPLLAFRQGCSYRAQAEHWLRETGAAPVSVIEMGTLDGILGCVTAGIGIAVVPRSSAERSMYRDDFDIEDLPAAHRHSQTSLIWRRDREPGKPLRELIGILAAENSG